MGRSTRCTSRRGRDEEALIQAQEITLIVQVNGKLRDRIDAPSDISEEAARELALSSAESVLTWKAKSSAEHLRTWQAREPRCRIAAICCPTRNRRRKSIQGKGEKVPAN